MVSLPLVSIVLANYNYVHYIGSALGSALAQTYPNVEIVVLDNGSTDGSVEILNDVWFRGIKTHMQTHKEGVGRAWNDAAELSTGDFFVPLSPDDVLHPLFLERLMPVMLSGSEDLAVVYSSVQFFGNRTDIWRCGPFDLNLLKQVNVVSPTGVIRRSIWKALGGHRDISYGDAFVSMDWDLWLRMAYSGYRGILVPEPLFIQRIHSESFMANHPIDAKMIQAIRRANPEIFNQGG